MTTRLVAIVVLLAGALLANVAQRAVDPGRRVAQDQWATVVMPQPRTVAIVSQGQPTLAADLLWLRLVLRFADTYEDPERSDVRWLRAMVDTVIELDPSWRSVYFYGGSMLRVVDDIDASDSVFERAREVPTLRQDFFFPFALAMNAWLHHDDPVGASELLQQAAGLPGAPAWYASAAVALVDEAQGRRAAIEMVRRTMESEEDDRVRKSLEEKLKLLMHDELSERITQAYGGAVPAWLSSVTTLPDGRAVPPDPHGRGWIVGADGVIRSRTVEEERRERAQNTARAFLIRPVYTVRKERIEGRE